MTEADQILSLIEAGRRFKEARKRKGFTLQEVGEKIRVAPRFLESIEEGDLSSIPAAVYAKGFVRSYARYLGLDEGPLLSAVDKAGLREPVQRVEAQAAAPPSRRFDAQGLKRIGIAAGLVLVVGVGAGLAIKAAVKLWKYSERARVPPSPFDAIQSEKGKMVSGKRSAVPPEVVLLGAKQVAVSVTAFQDCWIQYQLDERAPKEVLINPGQSLALKAKGRVRVLIGNAAGVSISGPNGPVRMPAKAGKVVHLLFTERGAEKLNIPVALSSTISSSGTLLVQ